MLFIFGRLLVSVSAMALGQPRDLTCTPARKNLRDVPGLVALTQLYFRISLVGLGAHHFLLYCVPLFVPLPNLFPLYLSTSPQKHPSPHSHIHLLFSWHFMACYCFCFRLIFTKALLPYVLYFHFSIIKVR